MSKLLTASCIAAIAALGAAAPTYADPNPHNNSCQAVETGSAPYTSVGNTPGNAATAPGSVFNEPGFNSVNGGKGGIAYNKPHNGGGIAQYDTACAQTLKTGTGTPMQPIPAGGLPMEVPNNSLATRTADGVISHMGNGATK
jgi:hypothetical protein